MCSWQLGKWKGEEGGGERDVDGRGEGWKGRGGGRERKGKGKGGKGRGLVQF